MRELPGAGLGPTPDKMNKCCLHTELSSHEGTRSEFNPSKTVIKLGIDVHQEFYVVVLQEGGSNPKPAQRFKKEAFLCWAAKLKQESGAEIHAVYEACGFGFGMSRAASRLTFDMSCPLDGGVRRHLNVSRRRRQLLRGIRRAVLPTFHVSRRG